MNSSFSMQAVACALVIGAPMLPLQWSGNEINYFDLAFRYVNPGAFGPDHSIFDSSDGRAISFALMGSTVWLFGFETAKTILALLLWGFYSLSLAFVGRVMRLSVAEAAAALLVFILTGQSLVGEEWLFGTVEAKLFAYVAVLFGIGLALLGRWHWAIVCVALATYFHFLIGGFWAVALFLLHRLLPGSFVATARLSGLFFALILPIFVVLMRERTGLDVDVTGLDLSINEIYAEIRVPHHVAPFEAGLWHFAWRWLPGLIMHLALALALWVLAARDGKAPDRISLWLVLLNLYVLAAAAIAFMDRHTHLLAVFYLFRPSGLIFLLTCFAIAHHIKLALRRSDTGRTSIAVLILAMAVALPNLAERSRIALGSPDNRLEAALSDTQRDLVNWLRANTPRDAAILLEPSSAKRLAEGAVPMSGLERLTGRPFIVNFKFAPTSKSDLVTWYRRLQARTAFFSGDCSQLNTLGADFVVFVSTKTFDVVKHCVHDLYRNRKFILSKVREDIVR